ncbi:MAG: response regulator [Opitutaceae bacterium]|nr:response regulator [Opitutaceae bacterium]
MVDRQSEADATHLLLEASAEGLHLVIRVRIDPTAERPRFEGSVIRATGVYVGHRNFAGDLTSIALWVQSLAAVQVCGSLRDDPRFNAPVVRIDQIGSLPSTGSIHLVGTVHAFDNPGATVTLRDATGQVVVSTAQTRDIRVGQELEAVGLPEMAGVQRRLRDARVRPLAARAQPASPPGEDATASPLRLADQVLALKPEAADRGLPVQLLGVATWMDPDRATMFVQDTSGGVEIRLPLLDRLPPVLPCAVLLKGRTTRGAFAPLVAADSVVWSNPLGSPTPRIATLDEMLTGRAHGRWVGVQALLRAVRREGRAIQLDLTTATGEFVAYLPPDEPLDARAQPGSLVTIHGVCYAEANAQRQLTGVRLLVPSPTHVSVEQAAPTDPFALPARPIASLREFGPADALLQRVCTLGTVLHHEPGRYICLQDGNDALLVLSRDSTRLTPGDRVEAVGLPGREGTRVVLREATYRRTGPGAEPAPLPLPDSAPQGEAYDGRLVQLTGAVIGIQELPTESIITIQTGKRHSTAAINRRRFDLPRCPLGSVVQLRGVYRAIYDEYRRPIDFSLRLRSMDDIAVLQAPPLWTLSRALAAAGGLLLLTAAVLGWLAVLRSRVGKQTRQIRAQLERQQRLETALMQAQRVESLALLAGGIAHDFNNLLTGILGNISFARLDPRAVAAVGDSLADAELATLRARDLTQRLLVFTKGGEPSRSVVSLPELVRESARFALHGSKVRGDFDLPDHLWLADVDRVQIAQVVQNLVINAVQAMPAGGTVHLSLANETIASGAKMDLQAGRYLRLTTTDTGTGIPPELLPKIFDPYFTTKRTGNGLGLATVFSIVRRHGGHIEVESSPGHGTTFRLWLPAAERAQPAPASAPGLVPPPAAPPAPESVRILLMDDDASIRRIAALALLHAGYEVTTTVDGHEAVEEFALGRGRNRPYRLVILDLTVPGEMGGQEAMVALREFDPDVRAIVSTGNPNHSCFSAPRAHGFDVSLAKPYEVQQLLASVAAALGPRPG